MANYLCVGLEIAVAGVIWPKGGLLKTVAKHFKCWIIAKGVSIALFANVSRMSLIITRSKPSKTKRIEQRRRKQMVISREA